MKTNLLQFSVVREDPEVEAAVSKRLRPDAHLMLIGSGGCTALTLAARYPAAKFTLIEQNESQIQLVRDKVTALMRATKRDATLNDPEFKSDFSIGSENVLSLNSCGNFESLFRSLKLFIYEFVMEREGWLSFFEMPNPAVLTKVFESKYWPVAFDLFFSDSILTAMFTEHAVQHAPKNSYPAYFRKVLETGLLRRDAAENYFLHHILLGHYLDQPRSLPSYLTAPPARTDFTFERAFAQNVSSYAGVDLISFSNIFDWMGEAEVENVLRRVMNESAPGTYVIYRQLNNVKNFRPHLGDEFIFDDTLAAKLLLLDRSLFYSGLHIARKIGVSP